MLGTNTHATLSDDAPTNPGGDAPTIKGNEARRSHTRIVHCPMMTIQCDEALAIGSLNCIVPVAPVDDAQVIPGDDARAAPDDVTLVVIGGLAYDTSRRTSSPIRWHGRVIEYDGTPANSSGYAAGIQGADTKAGGVASAMPRCFSNSR